MSGTSWQTVDIDGEDLEVLCGLEDDGIGEYEYAGVRGVDRHQDWYIERVRYESGAEVDGDELDDGIRAAIVAELERSRP